MYARRYLIIRAPLQAHAKERKKEIKIKAEHKSSAIHGLMYIMHRMGDLRRINLSYMNFGNIQKNGRLGTNLI